MTSSYADALLADALPRALGELRCRPPPPAAAAALVERLLTALRTSKAERLAAAALLAPTFARCDGATLARRGKACASSLLSLAHQTSEAAPQRLAAADALLALARAETAGGPTPREIGGMLPKLPLVVSLGSQLLAHAIGAALELAAAGREAEVAVHAAPAPPHLVGGADAPARRHARAAVGAISLPFGVAVEIDGVFEIA